MRCLRRLGVAGLGRLAKPPHERLRRRAPAEVLLPLPRRLANALLLLLDVRHLVKAPATRGPGDGSNPSPYAAFRGRGRAGATRAAVGARPAPPREGEAVLLRAVAATSSRASRRGRSTRRASRRKPASASSRPPSRRKRRTRGKGSSVQASSSRSRPGCPGSSASSARSRRRRSLASRAGSTRSRSRSSSRTRSGRSSPTRLSRRRSFRSSATSS